MGQESRGGGERAKGNLRFASPLGRYIEAPLYSLTDLLDAGDRLVDRLLGADALRGDAVDGIAPDVLLLDPARPPLVVRTFMFRRCGRVMIWMAARMR